MEPLRHVLVATDFNPASGRALERAVDLASAFGSRLTVMHVMSSVFLPDIPVVPELPREERDMLDRAMVAVKARCPLAQAVVREGEPAEEIARAAEELGADLIVLGSHARRGLAHAVLGSVAERVLRDSKVPVLTVHGFWFADRSDAGEALADEVAATPAHAPVVVAISRDAVPVASAVATRMNAPLELLLTQHLARGGAAFGAVSETGELRVDPGALVGAEERRMLVHTARTVLDDAADVLHTRPWEPDLWRRTVILVSDALSEPWTALVAADVVGKRGSAGIAVVAPVATAGVVEALRRQLPRVVVLHELPPGQSVETAYRDPQSPSTKTILATLKATTAYVA
jgi:nucleotide-binding universal stress UspA family protein/predicted phosphoribosyltransferase